MQALLAERASLIEEEKEKWSGEAEKLHFELVRRLERDAAVTAKMKELERNVAHGKDAFAAKEVFHFLFSVVWLQSFSCPCVKEQIRAQLEIKHTQASP